MIFQKYKVGCGVLINPNGSSLRCGDKVKMFNAAEYHTQLCEHCSVKHHANSMMDALSRKPA